MDIKSPSEKQEMLDKIKSSKTFCILPWIHQHVMPDSTVLPCCVAPYDDTFGDLKKQSIEEIWNSEKYTSLRKAMMEGKASSTCNHCYSVEKNGFESLRDSAWIRFQRFFDLVAETEPSGFLPTLHSKYIDVRFSNLCNLKCMGCSPSLSSSWYDDHQKLYNYKSDKARVLNVADDAPVFWERFQNMAKDSHEIYFGGGEPLITKEHFEILQLLIADGKTNVKLTYNNNLTTLTYGKWDLGDLWDKFDSVMLGLSIDDIGPRAEYFRNGTKWKVIVDNLKLLRKKHPRVSRYVNCTISALNVYYLPELFDFLVSEHIIRPSQFNINLMLDPYELTIQSLPPELKKKITDKISNFLFKLANRGPAFGSASKSFSNIINFMNEVDTYEVQGPIFRERIRKLDEIRGTSFRDVYPEISEVLDG